MKLEFTKMHGLKNDFVVMRGPPELRSEQVRQLCDRQSGVGADGLLIVTPTDSSRVQMKYFNADGSVAEMCGNGLRCVARFAVENKLVMPGTFTVITDAGPLKVVCRENNFKAIEVQVGKLTVVPQALRLLGYDFYEANVGNPHAVTFINDINNADVSKVGPQIEENKHFPNKTNVEFVELKDTHAISMRVWERGVGETQACATGMVAAAGTAVKLGNADWPVEVTVPGGKAQVWLDQAGYARMLGPAEVEFADSVEI